MSLWRRKKRVQHQMWRQRSPSSKCRMCTSMMSLVRKRRRMLRHSTALRIIMTSGHEHGTSTSECHARLGMGNGSVCQLHTCNGVLNAVVATDAVVNGKEDNHL